MDTSLHEPRQATSADHQTILNLYKDASDWLHTKNTDQWARPWPSWEARDQRILASIAAGATWIVGDGTDAVATITAHHRGDAALWTRRERRQPAVYVHRLIVNRDYARRGVGAGLLDWAARRAAAQYGARQVRIDVWTTNTALHDYYRGIGFLFVRFADCPASYPSRALFQRPIPVPGRAAGDCADD